MGLARLDPQFLFDMRSQGRQMTLFGFFAGIDQRYVSTLQTFLDESDKLLNVRIMLQFAFIICAKCGVIELALMIGLAQRRGGCNRFCPIIQGGPFLFQTSRPQPVHQYPKSIVLGGRLIYLLPEQPTHKRTSLRLQNPAQQRSTQTHPPCQKRSALF